MVTIEALPLERRTTELPNAWPRACEFRRLNFVA
jgi:hypothetical protein